MESSSLRYILIILAVFVLFALVFYYNNKQKSQKTTEKFYQQQQTNDQMSFPSLQNTSSAINSVVPGEEHGNEYYRPVDFETAKQPSDCFPRDRLSSEDLLPKDAANSKWAQVNPAGQGEVSNQNFLTAGWAVGINTVSGSLRNANLQLRSEPPNKRMAWPINNSTIEPDLMRRPLEIGEAGCDMA